MTEPSYDVIVVGGGAFGVAAAWDATLRGLRVAVLEQNDFCSASSGNSFRMLHGGVRYLQHLDLVRLWRSNQERAAFFRIAPHLVHPLPIVIPTHGVGLEGRSVLWAGLKMYDALTVGRNRGIREGRLRIPRSRILSSAELLELFPGLSKNRPTGAGLFADGQMYHPARLGLAMLGSAVEGGADAANYAKVVGFIRKDKRVHGVRVRDDLSGDVLEVRGRTVLLAAGGWSQSVLSEQLGVERERPTTFSRDLCFVVDRPPPHEFGVAVLGATKDPDAIVSRSRRHLFVVPWRDVTLVGVWHRVHNGSPDELRVAADELERFVKEVNAGYPGLDLSSDEIKLVNAGLVPFGENAPESRDLRYGHRSRIIDHAATDGIEGLLSLMGIRWTTARSDAAAAIDLVVRRAGSRRRPSRTRSEPLLGADFESLEALQSGARSELGEIQDRDAIAHRLARHYGSRFGEVLEQDASGGREQVAGSATLVAEVLYAVRAEMALRLDDVVLRRTGLGVTGKVSDETLIHVASIVAGELGWSDRKRDEEVERLRARAPLSPHLVPG